MNPLTQLQKYLHTRRAQQNQLLFTKELRRGLQEATDHETRAKRTYEDALNRAHNTLTIALLQVKRQREDWHAYEQHHQPASTIPSLEIDLTHLNNAITNARSIK